MRCDITSAARCMTRARSMKCWELQAGNPAFAAATALRASALVPFWNRPRTSLRFAGDVSANVPPRDFTPFPLRKIGWSCPNSPRTFATPAS